MSGPASSSAGGRPVPWPAALIVFATAWIYGPTLHGGWLWDDGLEIFQNPAVRSAAGWRTPWSAPVGMDYLPLKSSLQWLEWHLWGDQVLGYHLANVALHLLSAFLLWRLLSRLGVRLAWFGGLLFAVHPVAVESVAWISEFKNTLSLPPLLLAAIAWVDFDRTGRPADRWRSLGWFTVAMLCKSSVVMLPAVLLLFAWWRRRLDGAAVRATAPFWLVSAGLGLVTLWFQSHRAIGPAGPAAGWAARLGEAGGSILHYTGTCLVPVGLAPVYPPSGWPPLVAWAVVIAVLAGLWLRRSTWGRPALLGLGWFLLNLVPVLGLIPLAYLRVAPVADHLAYLPLAGWAGLVAAALGAAGEAGSRRALAVAAAGAILALAWTSRAYAGNFQNERALWSYAVARNPGAWLAWNNLGRTDLQEGKAEQALPEFAAAQRLRPDSAEVRANAGAALERLGRAGPAEARYREAIGLDPGFAGAHYDLGHLLLQAGRPLEASDEFRAALRLDPALAAAHNNLGLAHSRHGLSAEARREYDEALRLNPRLAEALLNLGNAAFREGRVDEAVGRYRAALRIDPAYEAAHQNLGAALERLGRTGEARAQNFKPPRAGRGHDGRGRRRARRRPRPLAGAAFLVAATLAAYWPVLGAGFVWDDEGHVTRADLRSLHGLGRIWFELGATQQYYPVLHSAFWLEHRLWGDTTLGYHLCNLGLHAAAAFSFSAFSGSWPCPGPSWAALVFAVHPVGVETVAWISEQKNTLSAVFYLLSALAYLRFDEERRPRWYLAALGLFLLAVLSKTVTATLPAALLVLCWWRRGRVSWKRDAVPLLPWLTLAVAGGLTTAWVEQRYIGAQGTHFDLSLVQRCLLAGRAVWFYAGTLAWPSHLVFIYPRWVIDAHAPAQFLFPAAAAAVLLGLWALRRRARGPLAAALLFVGTLFPALGFFNVYPFVYSFVADHFQYLADLGPFAVAGAAIAGGWRRTAAGRRRAIALGTGLLLAALGVLTWRQARTYHDLETLYRTTIARNPACWFAEGNLGVILAGTGRLPEAMEHYKAAVRLNPDVPQTYNNLGNALTLQRRWPEAFAAYGRALELWPDFTEARFDWATALSNAGRLRDAAAFFGQALRQRPNYPEAEFGLGNALANLGRLDAAATHYRAAIRLRPGYAEAHANLGLAEVGLGRRDQALIELGEALRLRPDYAEAHAYLGLALAQVGRLGEAVAQYREALRLNPANADVHYQLAIALRALGDAAGAAAEFRLSGSPAPEASR